MPWVDGKWVDDTSSSGGYPQSGTPAEQRKWLLDHGYNPDTFGNNPTSPGAGFVIGRNGELIPQGTGPTASGGIPAGELFDMGGTVYRWNGKTYTKASVADTKGYWASGGGYSVDNSTGTGFAGNASAAAIAAGSGGGGGGSAQRLTTDDPRYWDLEYAKLAAQYENMGLDAESARRQALATLLANRNNNATNIAQTSAGVAKQIADFAGNPRDAVSELMYRNQVGGSTPFGDMTSKNFGEYGKALADKAQSIFQPVGQDLQQARLYRDAPAPVDFYGAETRAQLGLPPTSAQSILGAPPVTDVPQGAAPVGPISTPPDVLTQLTDRLKAMSPEDQRSFREYVTGGNSPQPMAHGGRLRVTAGNITGSGFGSPGAFANGGSLNFDTMFADRGKPGFSPSSSEGGTAMNLHERAVVVGESGHVYATLGEKRPDGSIRSESLQVKPLKSETEKDKRLADGKKAVIESQKQTLSHFDQGGTVNATPQADDFMAQLSQYLKSLGGSGGGTGGYSTPLPSLRLLAGAPANALESDPVAQDYALSGYSALGIDPRTVASTIRRFTPESPQNNIPRVSFA